ncbi:alpha/beta fold hydrolase [Tsukamurella sp. 8F]|uniref:alpha/beta fold hydrolase n=1 Tax=unclassified Tsukamurella TaxID=2633480 RepID=UPI0023B9B2E7|nr:MULTISPECIES: alpha/beta fold hydrolase [unclassified Tsukamurella]MDF0528525.1 alpha/beta fold hydrolase [Tsukamurella sp. 8J]MDF0586351.1 alpha/beta fold hydrolase [Tsukamurella sp. 8F]
MSAPRFITTAGRRVRVRTTEADAGLPVVLLHGITRSLEDWDPLFDRLGDRRLIAMDLAGYGWSAAHPDGADLPQLAEGVGQTLDALGVDGPAHVVGNSLGGAVTMAFARLRPHQVETMTLVDPAGFGQEVTPLLRLLGLPVLGRFLATQVNRPSAVIQERLIFADKAFATRERVDHALEIGRTTDAGVTTWRTSRALGSPRAGILPEWRKELLGVISAAPRPTLGLWGDHDRILPPKHLEMLRKSLPHAETHLLPGIGHMPQLECPDEFAALLTDFLARNAA